MHVNILWGIVAGANIAMQCHAVMQVVMWHSREAHAAVPCVCCLTMLSRVAQSMRGVLLVCAAPANTCII